MFRSKAFKRRVRHKLTYWFVRVLLVLAGIMPRIVWLWMCGLLGSAAYRFARQTRESVIRHLSMAFPEKSEIEITRLAKNTFKKLGKNAGEILRSSKIKSLSELDKILVTHGYENFEKAHAKGNGVIFLSCHIGAFDLQITNMAMRGLNPNIVGTPLKNTRLNDLLWKYRNQYGAVAIARGKETFRMIKVLKSGGSVALLIDQDTNVKKAFVDFFGMPAATPVGAAVLALKTGAAVIPTYIHLGADNLQHMHVFPEIPIQKSDDEDKDVLHYTQVFTRFIEDRIREHPDQWVWMHERWKTRPE